MQQLEELTESDSEMRNVRAKLEQQSQALQTMQETFEAVEAEKAEEHEQALSRSGQTDMSMSVHMTVSVTTSMPASKLEHDHAHGCCFESTREINTVMSAGREKHREAVMHKQGMLQISSYTL